MTYTGQSLKRLEDPRLLTGQGAFLDDLTFPEMLYAAVLRSPHAHASIRAIDTAAARHAPGRRRARPDPPLPHPACERDRTAAPDPLTNR